MNKPYSITLELEGKKKTITQTGLKTSALRKVLKYYKWMEEINEQQQSGQLVDELEIIDSMIVLICDIFTDERVDFENVENSIEASELSVILEDILANAMGVDDSKK